MTPREALADEIEAGLVRHVLAPLYPRCVDPAGGFHERYDRAWNPLPDDGRSLVAQARHTWTCATMAEAGFAGDWRAWTAHGAAFLLGAMSAGGGRFHWRLDGNGEPTGPHAGGSVLYGHAFAMFALAAAARAVPESDAPGDGVLEAAKEAFAWYERAHRDPERPGSFEYADGEGRPSLPPENEVGIAGDERSQNSPLHLLEALTELYRVWPNETVARRVRETVALLTGTMFMAPGHLAFAIGAAGGLVENPRTYGHDVEAGHLVLAAEAVLGETTPLAQERARNLIRAPQAAGFTGGSLAAGPGDATRTWWVQAENLLALATLAGEDESLLAPLTAQWAWMRDRQADAEHGGFLPSLDAEGNALGDGAKAGPWKTGYHDGRALLFSARLLRGSAVGEDPDERVPRAY